MHDMDRTLLESAPGVDQEVDAYEYVEEEGLEGEFNDEGEGDSPDSPFSETEEIDLASELLAVNDEGELDQFIGGLLKRAIRAGGQFLKSPAGRALGGILKAAARKALPILGSAAGGFLGGPAGAALGGKLASLAGQKFGLEVEGLSEEDAQFEIARRFVRLGGAAAVSTANAAARMHPMSAAQAGMLAAARRHAPGFIPNPALPTLTGSGPHTGRWIRRGRKIIILGL